MIFRQSTNWKVPPLAYAFAVYPLTFLCSSIDEENAHKLELAALAEKDPEFFKYLQENDKELLNFSVPASGKDVDADEDMDSEDGGLDVNGEESYEEMEDEEEETPVLTSDTLKGWQKAILEVRFQPIQGVTTLLTVPPHRLGR